MQTVKCEYCGKEYEKYSKYVDYNIREGLKFYCSRKCVGLSKNKKHDFECFTCGIKIKVKHSEFKKSKSKKFFCSSSCAAKINSKRKHTTEQNLKIKKILLEKYSDKRITKKCLICGKEFKSLSCRKRKVCSRACRHTFMFGTVPYDFQYSKEDVLKLIKNLIEKQGYIPSSKITERRLVHGAKKYFGSWNKAIKELGFKPNSQKYVKRKTRCLDGHISDSISEMTVDNWLYAHGIEHEKNKKYPEGQLTCDFYLPDYDIWIEYFGLFGNQEYQKTIERKKIVCEKHNLKLIEIYPNDIYPKSKLNDVLSFCVSTSSAEIGDTGHPQKVVAEMP